LGEALARRRIFARELEGVPFEGERAERHADQSGLVSKIMDELFEAAVKQANLPIGSSILDVGAGMCTTSSALAGRGYDVTAVETEATNLLHIRFAATDEGEPPWIDLPHRRVYAQEPELRPHLFDRVVAPIHRLPFETSSFDAVFCRSVLHHVDDLSLCIKEMMRVLKPGGIFVACSEPARGIFDNEDDLLVWTIDKEDGLNEQVPSWFDYWRSVKPWSKGITVQAWLHEGSHKVRLFDKLDIFCLRKRIWPGLPIQGWRLIKLLPFSSSINVLAERTNKFIEVPKRVTPTFSDFGILDLAEVACPPSLSQSIANFHADTQRLAKGWRRLRLMKGGLSSTFIPSAAGEKDLQIGWRPIINEAEDHSHRTINKHCLVTLLWPGFSSDGSLKIEFRSPGREAAQATILANGKEIGNLEALDDSQWITAKLPVPQDILDFPDTPNQEQAVDIEFRGAKLQSSLHDARPGEAALAIRRISFCQ
jgi:SAM-dependent methyltransferase